MSSVPPLSGRASPEPFRILTLDGGGIKGVFAASFLAELEDALGEPLVDYFDLVAGTSTGGIIALGLGLGLPAQDILQFYETHGPAVFPRRRLRLFRVLATPKYQAGPLQAALKQTFGDRLLGESSTRLVIPSTNFETGEVHVFKTAHHTRFVRDYKLTAVDVAMATAAAPTYFRTHRLPIGIPLIDGGLWANNPMGVAAVEATGLLELPKGTVKLLSLSCTESPISNRDPAPAGLGLARWAPRLLETLFASQSSAALGTAQLLLGHENVWRIAPSVGPNHYKMDRTDDIASLRGLGASEARKSYPEVRETFLDRKRPAFVPHTEVTA